MIEHPSQIAFELREIKPEDNLAVAHIIKESLTDLGLNKPGTVFGDEETNRISTLFTQARTRYWVVVVDNKPIAGAGINLLADEKAEICELQKMYVDKKYRNKGFAQMLIDNCLQFAKLMDFKKVYLETMDDMNSAQSLYLKNGFKKINKRLGNTGHFDCHVYMLKHL